MKRLIKCVSLLCILTLLIGVKVNAQTIEEIVEIRIAKFESIPVTGPEQANYIRNKYSDLFLSKKNSYHIDFSPDYTKLSLFQCDDNSSCLNVGDVNIEYIYDKDIKSIADEIINRINNFENDIFELSFYEYINYNNQLNEFFEKRMICNDEGECSGVRDGENAPSMLMYNKEFKELSGNHSFTIKYSQGNGSGPCIDVETGAMGLYCVEPNYVDLWYDDIYYGSSNKLIKAVYKNVLYIDDDSTDVIEAIKNKLKKYVDLEYVKISKIGDQNISLDDYINMYKEEIEFEWDNSHEISTHPSYNKTKEDYVNEAWTLITGNGKYASYLYDENAEQYIYCYKENNKYPVYSFVVIKDSSKSDYINKFESKNIESGVELETDAVIPADANLKVEKIESGDNYSNIITLLNNSEVEMYDIKLYSYTSDKFITSSGNGVFKIKIPLKESFLNKKLFAFYIDEEGNIEKIDVNIIDSYAVFETNHLSIYTIGEDKVLPKTRNPKTGDNIMIYIMMLLLSSVSLLCLKK